MNLNQDLGLTQKELENLTDFTPCIAMEAAMCAWEHLLNSRYSFESLGGAAQARMCCGSLAKSIHIGYCIANVDDRLGGYVSYDWDFVPWFLDNCVIWDSEQAHIYGAPDLVPDWIDRCRRAFEPTETELLRECLNLLNTIPNQRGSYKLAAKISRRLS